MKLSFTLINKGNPEALIRSIDSVYGALYREGDECIVVDTGSSGKDFSKIKKALKDFPNSKLIDRRDLAVDYAPLIQDGLGESYVKEFKSTVQDCRGLLDFSEARQVALDAATNEVVFWIDSDDVLTEEEPGYLRQTVDEVFEDGTADALFMPYRYSFDKDGNCITWQQRERFVRRGRMYWKGKCHETLIPFPGIKPGRMVTIDGFRAAVEHTEARKPHRISDIRNFVILNQAYKKELAESDVDPRTVLYLGNSYRGLEKFRHALAYYKAFDKYSGSEDDRFAAKYYSAHMYMHPKMQRYADAYATLVSCLEIKPRDPRLYASLQSCCYLMAQFEESLQWYQSCISHKMPSHQLMSFDPLAVSFRPHLLAAMTLKELNRPDEGIICVGRAWQVNPTESTKQFCEQYQAWARETKLHESLQRVSSYMALEPKPKFKAIQQLMGHLAVQPEVSENAGFGRRETSDPREPKPEIAIYAPGSWENWGPKNRELGIGGSEKMILILSEAIQKTGRANVTVYTKIDREDRGVHNNGVRWEHFSAFDHQKPRHAVVFWRCPELSAHVGTPSKKRFLWLHDVTTPSRLSEEVQATFDYIQFQSNYHAEPTSKTLSPEKRWVARNAIEPVSDKKVKRNEKQVLYCSSPDRGLLTAAKIVEAAQKIDPEIHLVAAYGIPPHARKMWAGRKHFYCPDLGHESSCSLYERELYAKLDKINATMLHRVGFEELEGLMKSSGVWLYPTRFWEISCMSAMEAQANGCKVVATNKGALAETIFNKQFCLPELPDTGEVTQEYINEAAETLVKAINTDFDREAQIKEAHARFNVGDLAAEWLDKLEVPDAQEEGVQETETQTQADEREKVNVDVGNTPASPGE